MQDFKHVTNLLSVMTNGICMSNFVLSGFDSHSNEKHNKTMNEKAEELFKSILGISKQLNSQRALS